jgi:hypothetical protein
VFSGIKVFKKYGPAKSISMYKYHKTFTCLGIMPSYKSINDFMFSHELWRALLA